MDVAKLRQDRVYPLEADLLFSRYLCGFMAAKSGKNGQCNFVFSDNTKTDYPTEIDMTFIKIPEAADTVRKLIVWYHGMDRFAACI